MNRYLTFELYLDDGEHEPVFEAYTCPSRDELVPTLRRLLDERGLRSVEVREMGVPLFTVTR
jgi:hypothetical protein